MKIKEVEIRNFKGIREKKIYFSDLTVICGQNASYKTTIFDAFSWLFNGKDSLGNAQFEIRPLNADGTKVHNVEIGVTGTIEHEGVEHTLSRTQVENWVKKRGTTEATLQGNVTKYEVDGYPRSEAEYRAFIDSICAEKIFRLLTSPMAFTSLPWKEQRAILMEFVLEASDAELARGFGGYDEILDELAKAPSTDDILKKYASQLKALKQEQTELPVRIDEAMQSKVDVDAVNIAAHKKDLLATIDEYEQKMASYAGRANEMKSLVADKANCESEIQRLTAKYEREAYEVRHNLEKKVSDVEVKIDLAKRRKDAAQREAITLKANAEGIVNVNRKLSEKLGVPGRCPTCGQALDDEAIKRRDESVSERIRQNEDEIHAISVKVMDAENRAAEADEEIKTASEVIEEIKAGMATIPTVAEVIKQDAQYIMLNKQLADVLDRMTALNKTDDGQYDRLRMLVDGLRKEVANLDTEYAKSLRNDEIDARIENLRQEQMTVGDKIIHLEHLRDLTEAFMRQKMDTVSETINDQFDGVKFKLFDVQLNGGIAPTCECTVNGVPFASLNNGGRIVSGLKIIRTLQRHYGVSLPVFVDNAEAVSDGFMPEMDGQMILLEVTNDKELVVR